VDIEEVRLNPTLTEIQAILEREGQERVSELRISVLRNITVEPMEPYLRHAAHESGFRLGLTFGDFDNVYQEAVGGSPRLFESSCDAVLVFTRLEGLSGRLAGNFVALSSDDIAEEVQRIQQYFEEILRGIRAQTDALILWVGLEPPLYPALGILDAQSREGQGAVIATLNSSLRDALGVTLSAYLVDAGACLARVGGHAFYDQRFWHIGRAPYSLEGAREIAGEVFKFVRAARGKNKKCLVMDCDNTLWGGVVGEDGLAGIKLSKTYPGSPYYEFQQEIDSLANRGVILALCSKNNEDDVWQVFDHHPDMVLKRESITAWRVNWQDKATNLREIAEELNIGLDSIVFVDDSQFEAELVRQELAEVCVIHLPASRPAEYRKILAASGLFDALTLSDEDRRRGAMYRVDASRRQLRTAAVDMETYLRSLEMEIEFGFPDAFTAPRVAQQTQKTNQFNLTTRRYTEVEISTLAAQEGSDVVWMKLTDRFGGDGIVGTCILRYDGDRAEFDTFLLSCRVLGRGAERALLAEALELARIRGCRTAVGVYLKTAKNGQVEYFYKDNGLQEDTSPQIEDKRIFTADLLTYEMGVPAYFKSVTGVTADSERGEE
jgi:FkbH-like protein